MIRQFKQALAAIATLPGLLEGLQLAVRDLLSHLSDTGPSDERIAHLQAQVEQLAGAQHQTLAEAEAMLQRAQSQLKASRAAEERARGMMKRAQETEESEEGDEAGPDPFEEYGRAFQAEYAQGGAENGVQPVPGAMAADPRQVARTEKEALRALKFGGY